MAPMLLRLCTIVLLVLASLRVNAASVTGVIIANEGASSPAVHVAAVDQIQTTNRSGLTDLGSVGGAQNQMEETRREFEESLKTLSRACEEGAGDLSAAPSGDAQQLGDSR